MYFQLFTCLGFLKSAFEEKKCARRQSSQQQGFRLSDTYRNVWGGETTQTNTIYTQADRQTEWYTTGPADRAHRYVTIFIQQTQ